MVSLVIGFRTESMKLTPSYPSLLRYCLKQGTIFSVVSLGILLTIDSLNSHSVSLSPEAYVVALLLFFSSYMVGVSLAVRRIVKARKKMHAGEVLWIRNRRSMCAVMVQGLVQPVLFESNRSIPKTGTRLSVTLLQDAQGIFAFTSSGRDAPFMERFRRLLSSK